MRKWIEASNGLPEEGQMVSIKIGGSIIERVLFSEGRFWKKRIRRNVGHTWAATHWAAIEKKKKVGDILEIGTFVVDDLEVGTLEVDISEEKEHGRKSKD